MASSDSQTSALLLQEVGPIGGPGTAAVLPCFPSDGSAPRVSVPTEGLPSDLTSLFRKYGVDPKVDQWCSTSGCNTFEKFAYWVTSVQEVQSGFLDGVEDLKASREQLAVLRQCIKTGEQTHARRGSGRSAPSH